MNKRDQHKDNRRDASKRETRRLILDAARKLFSKKGMEECTVRDVAREAGVSPASVLVHFGSKTMLLKEALDRDIETVLTRLLESEPAEMGLLDRLMRLANSFLTLYDGNRDLYRALIRNTMFEPRSETPGSVNLAEVYLRHLAAIIDSEKTKGSIKADIDPQVASGALFSLYLGALTILLRTPEMGVGDVSRILESMTSQFLEGIKETQKQAWGRG